MSAVYRLHRELWVPQPLPVVFDFFSRAENLEQNHSAMDAIPDSYAATHPDEARSNHRLRLAGPGIPLRWLTEIERWNPPFEFVDVQAKGPYKTWRHTHRFSEVSGGTSIEDTVQYALPFGPLGRLVHRLQVARDLCPDL